MSDIGKQYNYKTLLKMRKFYLMYKNFSTVSRQLTWSHYVELLKFSDINIINYYINIALKQNLSVRELRNKIKNNEYERLDEYTKEKLINKQENKVNDFIKNPILIKNSYNYTEISEKILKQLIIEDFVKSEYKIKMGDRYNYIDLLLYNIKYNCYVVIELKVTELKAEYIGQVNKYMNYIDKNIKDIIHDRTIGIIICKRNK